MIEDSQLLYLRDTIISRPQDIFIHHEDCVKIAEVFLDKLNFVSEDLIKIYSEYSLPFFMQQLSSYTSSYYQKKSFFSTIKKVEYLLNDKAKVLIAYCLLENEQKFYNSCFHLMIKSVVDFIPAEEDIAIKVLKKYNGNINADGLNVLMAKIPDGEKNIKIQDVLKKCKIYQVLKKKELMDTDKKAREDFFKFIGKMPSLIEKINFDIKMTAEDLAVISPVARFNLLQYYFRYKIPSVEYPTYNKDPNTNHSKVTIQFIGYDKMKELLFPVLVKKNAQTSNWLKQYEVLLKASTQDL